MPTYAVGDLQGCRGAFERLLDAVDFGSEDRLWLLGDLVNRGEDSLGALRLAKSLTAQTTVVLGNHDLHFLAIYFGGHRPNASDTFDELLAAPDVAELAEWLCAQRLLHVDAGLGYTMVHAGLPHVWTLADAQAHATEVETALCDAHPDVSREHYFRALYGNRPDVWSDDLEGMDRLRLITNYLTRMRLTDANGRLEFTHKGTLESAPPGWHPWFDLVEPGQFGMKLLFGHWAALDGFTGRADVLGLDTGCVWGRYLSALHLESGEKMSVAA